MPICSYLVIPEQGATRPVQQRLAAMPACQVFKAENRELLVLVTETEGLRAEERVRAEVEALPGVEALLLTFGEIDPDTELADPLREAERRRRPAPSDSGSGACS